MCIVNTEFRNLPIGLEIPEDDLVILIGANNSGKSNILKYLSQRSEYTSEFDYVSPRRFDVVNQAIVDHTYVTQRHNEFNDRKRIDEEMCEVSTPDPIRELLTLNDIDRERVISWHNKYFGRIEIKQSAEDNKYSPPKVFIDGRRPTQQGSGSRAILSLLVRLLDPENKRLAIDEPEIGVEPQVQKKVFELIKKVSRGDDGLPKKQIYIATHSHLFLDKLNPRNNFLVNRNCNDCVEIKRATSESELQSIVFRLLGNSPNDLFFPNNILVVEGSSDQIFLKRIIEILDFNSLAVHYADGDGNCKYALPAIDQILKTTSYISMYKNRLCILVDKQVDMNRVQEWKNFLGTNSDSRVLILDKNGIEYYYPKSIMFKLTNIEDSIIEEKITEYLQQISSGSSSPTLGTFIGGKVKLAQAVAFSMSSAHLKEIDSRIVNLCKNVFELSKW